MARTTLLNVSIEGLDTLQALKAALDPKLYAKAQRRALTEASSAAKTAAGKAISARYNLKSARIKKDISGPFIRGDAAVLVFARRSPTLGQFGFREGTRGRQRGRGRGKGWAKPSPAGKPATARIFRGGSPARYPSVFLWQGVTFRRASGATRSGKGRIKAEYGPSIGSIFGGDSRFGATIREEVMERTSERFVSGYRKALGAASRGFG